MGAVGGTCKNGREGRKMIQNTPTEVPIFNEDDLDGIVNVYKDMYRYLKVWNEITLPSSISGRFFLGINANASRFENVFKRAALSSHQIRKIVQGAADANGIVGYGDQDHIFMHFTRKTSAQRMVDACMADTATMKRTGHLCVESVTAYQNLRGVTGLKQQAIIVASSKSEHTIN